MRRAYLVALVVLGMFFFGGIVYAGEAATAAPEDVTNWTAVALAVLGAFGVLDRLTRWVVKYRSQLMRAIKVLREVFAAIEAVEQHAAVEGLKSPQEAETAKVVGAAIKAMIATADETRDEIERDIVTRAAAEAEARTGHNGSATSALREAAPKSKAARFLTGLGTFAKFVGGFVPVAGRFIDR